MSLDCGCGFSVGMVQSCVCHWNSPLFDLQWEPAGLKAAPYETILITSPELKMGWGTPVMTLNGITQEITPDKHQINDN